MKNVLINKPGLFWSLFLMIASPVFSQDYTWMKGTSQTGQLGFYGILGTSSAGNTPGGRQSAVSWKDASGNFWMLGGEGFDHISNFGLLNDLWKYSVTTNQWTWIKGDDVIAQVSVFGTQGSSAASNKPSARTGALSWTDASGNFWLFGGYGYDGVSALGLLNDLWKYTLSTNEWTWIGGSTGCFQVGTYGTLGVPAPSNVPGARQHSVGWADASGNLWVFGGWGISTSQSNIGALNDLWKYNIATSEWTWVKGTNTLNQNGIYGTQGAPAPANNPGSRSSSFSWVDATGTFWMFGGEGWDASTPTGSGLLNDMWKYSASTNEWTWIKGTNSLNQNGVYSTQGTSNPANIPGARSGATTWMDGIGTFWMFGGEGYSASGTNAGDLNDLWKYNVSANEWMWVRGSSVIDQHGLYGTQGVGVFSNQPGARGFPVSWIDASNNLWFFGGYGQPAGTAPAGSLNDLWKYANCFISPITLTVTSNDSIICAGESASLTVTGSTNYLWMNNFSTASFLLITPTVNTTYTVFTSDANLCKYSAMFTQTVLTCTANNDLQGNMPSVVYPNPNNGEFRLKREGNNNRTVLTILNSLGQVVYVENLNSVELFFKTGLPEGLYCYFLTEDNRTVGSGKLIVE